MAIRATAGFSVGVASVRVVPSFSGFRRQVQSEVGAGMAGASRTAEEQGRQAGHRYAGGVGTSLKGLAEVIGGAFVVEKAAEFFKESIKAGGDAAKANQQLAARLKSTKDASQQSAESLGKLAEEQAKSTATTKTYQTSIENMLLTFTNVKGKIFSEALPAINDISAAMRISGPAAAKQLGKALNDPVKGLASLTRVGVQFTQAQKDQIAGWVKHGETARAQGLIIQQVEMKMGGAAAASVTPAQRFKAAIEGLQEQLGEKLYPVVGKIANVLTATFVPAIGALISGLTGSEGPMKGWLGVVRSIGTTINQVVVGGFRAGQQAVQGFMDGFRGTGSGSGFGVFFAQLGKVARPALQWLGDNRGMIINVTKALVGLWLGVKAIDFAKAGWGKLGEIRAALVALVTPIGSVTASLFGLDAATAPVAAIGFAVVAAGAAFVLAYTKIKPFHDFVNTTLKDLGAFAVDVWKNYLKPALTAMGHGFQDIWKQAQPALMSLWSTVKSLGSTIATIWTKDIWPALSALGKAFSSLWGGSQKKSASDANGSMHSFALTASQVSGIVTKVFHVLATIIGVELKAVAFEIKAVAAVVGWLAKNIVAPMIGIMIKAVALLVTSFVTAGKAIGKVLKDIGIAATWLWKNAIAPAWDGITRGVTFLLSTFRSNFALIVKIFLGAMSVIVDGAAKGFGFLPLIGGKLKSAAKAFDKFRDDVNASMGGIKPKTIPVAITFNGVPQGKITGHTYTSTTGFTYADGGQVPWNAGAKGKDSVHAMVMPGEYIIPTKQTQQNLGVLQHIRAGGKAIPAYATGGMVSFDRAVVADEKLAEQKQIQSGTTSIVSAFVKASNAHAAAAAAAKASAYTGGGGGGSAATPGQAAAWIHQGLSLVGRDNPAWFNGISTIASRESGFNPTIVNTWDSNAKAGHPSMGFLQFIQPTFDQYALPGHTNILSAVDQVIADARPGGYIDSAYGGIGNVQQANPNLPPKGYARGTAGAAPGWAQVGERGMEWVFMLGGETVLPSGLTPAGAGSRGYAGGTLADRISPVLSGAKHRVSSDEARVAELTHRRELDRLNSLYASTAAGRKTAKAHEALDQTRLNAANKLLKTAKANEAKIQRDYNSALAVQNAGSAALAAINAKTKAAIGRQLASVNAQLGVANAQGSAYRTNALGTSGTSLGTDATLLAGSYAAGTARLKALGRNIALLAKRGLNRAVLNEILALDPAAALTYSSQLLQSVNIRGLNRSVSAFDAEAASFGSSAENSVYGSVKLAQQAAALAKKAKKYAAGGRINEPIFGVGASGQTYTFGEKESEIVIPSSSPIVKGGAGSSRPVANFTIVSQIDGEKLDERTYSLLMDEMRGLQLGIASGVGMGG